MKNRHPEWFCEDLAKLIALLEEGKIKPVVPGRLPLEEIVHPHDLLEHEQVRGKAGVAFLFHVICGLPTSATPAPLSLKERLRLITHPRVVLALFPALLWNIGVYVLYPYFALLLQQQLHISDVSVLLAFFGLEIVLSNWISRGFQIALTHISWWWSSWSR